jgi:hypothetical protein
MTIESNIQNGHEPERHLVDIGETKEYEFSNGTKLRYKDRTKTNDHWWHLRDTRFATIEVVRQQDSEQCDLLIAMTVFPNGEMTLKTNIDGHKEEETFGIDEEIIDGYRVGEDDLGSCFKKAGLDGTCKELTVIFPPNGHNH